MSDPQTARPVLAPGQRWKPRYGDAASMTRIITQLTVAGVVYDEAWPSEVRGSFDRWATWADWLIKTGAELREETNAGAPRADCYFCDGIDLSQS